MNGAPAVSATFWADPGLPQLELRATADGRALRYGLHSHDEFSVGLIESGCSVYRSSGEEHLVGPGDLLLMNPGAVHACRALDDGQPWAYTLLYAEPAWLAGLQSPRDGAPFRPLREHVLRRPRLTAAFGRLRSSLGQPDLFERDQCCLDFFAALCEQGGVAQPPGPDARLQRAVDLLHDCCTERLRLDDLAQAAGLSAVHLSRLFRARYGLTPHAYLVDLRLRRSRALLRQGELTLAEVALASGFADQAHWQRHFRRQLAATPGAYRRQLLISLPAAAALRR